MAQLGIAADEGVVSKMLARHALEHGEQLSTCDFVRLVRQLDHSGGSRQAEPPRGPDAPFAILPTTDAFVLGAARNRLLTA